MGNENQLYSISLGVASLQGGLVGVATALSPATCRPFQVFSPSFFVGLELKNQRPSTEVGRGLQELGVTLIPAGSPQAKGRIERLWGTFQDRLVSELRRARAKTPSQAQVVLERYLPEHNRKFSKPALSEPAWRKANSTQIERALCFKQKRTVAKDHTVTFEGTLFQIPKPSPSRSYANKRIDVHVLLDGAVEFFYQNQKIARFDSKTT